jgi:hypothetical protein
MAQFVEVDYRSETGHQIDFSDFIETMKGATVRSCATGDDFVELGLTDQINIRFTATSDGKMVVYLASTLNEGEIAPLRVRIIDDDEVITAELLEHRIRALRQSFAITYMVESGRSGELKSAIIKNPKIDIEATFIPESDRVFIASASPGSFWVTLAIKTLKARNAVIMSLSLPFREGRQALLRRVEAETQLKELAVDDKRLEVGLKRIKGTVTALNEVEKIKDPEVKAIMKDALKSRLGQGDTSDFLSLPSTRRLPN